MALCCSHLACGFELEAEEDEDGEVEEEDEEEDEEEEEEKEASRRTILSSLSGSPTSKKF